MLIMMLFFSVERTRTVTSVKISDLTPTGGSVVVSIEQCHVTEAVAIVVEALCDTQSWKNTIKVKSSSGSSRCCFVIQMKIRILTNTFYHVIYRQTYSVNLQWNGLLNVSFIDTFQGGYNFFITLDPSSVERLYTGPYKVMFGKIPPVLAVRINDNILQGTVPCECV